MVKFEGILNGYDLNVIDENLISILIEKEIYKLADYKIRRNPKNYQLKLRGHFYHDLN